MTPAVEWSMVHSLFFILYMGASSIRIYPRRVYLPIQSWTAAIGDWLIGELTLHRMTKAASGFNCCDCPIQFSSSLHPVFIQSDEVMLSPSPLCHLVLLFPLWFAPDLSLHLACTCFSSRDCTTVPYSNAALWLRISRVKRNRTGQPSPC